MSNQKIMDVEAQLEVAIKKKLQKQANKIGVYFMEELPCFIMGLLDENNTPSQMKQSELDFYLRDYTHPFVDWLFLLRNKLKKEVPAHAGGGEDAAHSSLLPSSTIGKTRKSRDDDAGDKKTMKVKGEEKQRGSGLSMNKKRKKDDEKREWFSSKSDKKKDDDDDQDLKKMRSELLKSLKRNSSDREERRVLASTSSRSSTTSTTTRRAHRMHQQWRSSNNNVLDMPAPNIIIAVNDDDSTDDDEDERSSNDTNSVKSSSSGSSRSSSSQQRAPQLPATRWCWNAPTKWCRYGELLCTLSKNCPYRHPVCSFGNKCTNAGCPYEHRLKCKFFPYCYEECPFYHPGPLRTRHEL